MQNILIPTGAKNVLIDFDAAVTPPTNQIPVVNAGNDQRIKLPVNSVNLSGSATDPDGIVVAYLWEKLNGGAANIENPTSKTTKVSGLTTGGYVFRLSVVDAGGAAAFDDVGIIVDAADVIVTPPPAGYVETFNCGFDQISDVINPNNGQYGNGTVSNTVFKTGPGSFYSRPQNVSSGIRSEVQYTGTPQNPTEGAVEYDVRYEVIVPSNGCSLQWHPNTGGSSGSPYLMHDGGKFTFVVWKGGGNTYYPTGYTIKANVWQRFRIEYKFGSPSQGGYLRFFIDGAQILGKSNIQMGDGSGQYLKVGYNGWDGNSAASRIYYDNLKVYKKV